MFQAEFVELGTLCIVPVLLFHVCRCGTYCEDILPMIQYLEIGVQGKEVHHINNEIILGKFMMRIGIQQKILYDQNTLIYTVQGRALQFAHPQEIHYQNF